MRTERVGVFGVGKSTDGVVDMSRASPVGSPVVPCREPGLGASGRSERQKQPPVGEVPHASSIGDETRRKAEGAIAESTSSMGDAGVLQQPQTVTHPAADFIVEQA